MKNLLIAIVFMGTFSACLSEFEGELGKNMFEKDFYSFLEITGHEQDIDFAEFFFTNEINFQDFEKLKGIVIFENRTRLESIIDDPSRVSFIRTNLIPNERYCFEIAFVDDLDRIVKKSEPYCLIF